jgi:hypothetical protein
VAWKFSYAPEGEEPRKFELDVDNLSTDEAEAIDEAGGTQWVTLGRWVDLINQGGWRAWRVALWIYLRRTDPELGFEEVKPKVGDLTWELPDDEPPKPNLTEESAEGKSGPADDDTSSP